MSSDNERLLAISNAEATALPHAAPVDLAEAEVDRGSAIPDATSAGGDGAVSE